MRTFSLSPVLYFSHLTILLFMCTSTRYFSFLSEVLHCPLIVKLGDEEKLLFPFTVFCYYACLLINMIFYDVLLILFNFSFSNITTQDYLSRLF